MVHLYRNMLSFLYIYIYISSGKWSKTKLKLHHSSAYVFIQGFCADFSRSVWRWMASLGHEGRTETSACRIFTSALGLTRTSVYPVTSKLLPSRNDTIWPVAWLLTSYYIPHYFDRAAYSASPLALRRGPAYVAAWVPKQ